MAVVEVSRPHLGSKGAPDQCPKTRIPRFATYERYVTTVHESAEHYATFVELWKDADPELQPRVEAALYRLDEIFAARR